MTPTDLYQQGLGQLALSWWPLWLVLLGVFLGWMRKLFF